MKRIDLSLIVFILIAIVYCVLLTNRPFSIICFIIYNAFYIQIPGLFFVKRRKVVLDKSKILLVAYFLGFGILTLEYYVFNLLHCMVLFIILNPIISVCYILKNRKRIGLKELKANNKWLLYTSCIIIILLFLSFIYMRIIPLQIEHAQLLNIPKDYMWHMGNVSSLSNKYPFYDYRIAEHKLYYHYFSDLLLGMCKSIFHLSSYDLIIKCTPFLISYIFGIGLYSFFKRNGINSFACCGLFFCSCTVLYLTTNATKNFESLINYHILTNVNGVALAMSAIFALSIYINESISNYNNNIMYYVYLFILGAVATGLKGPFAIVFIVALTISSVIQHLVYKKKDMILSCVILLLSFVIVYVFIIIGVDNIFKPATNNRAIELSISDTFQRTIVGYVLGEKIQPLLTGNNAIYQIVYLAIVLILGNLFVLGPLYIIFVTGLIDDLKRVFISKEAIDFDTIFLIVVSWLGIGGYWFVSQIGYSQLYFIFIAVPFIINYCVFKYSCMNKNVKIYTKKLFVFVFLLGSVFLTLSVIEEYHQGVAVRQEWGKLTNDIDNITIGELNGAEWIKNNTPKDSIIASDRNSLSSIKVDSTDNCTFFYYSAFCERQIYIEGFSYSDAHNDLIDHRLRINRDIYYGNPESFDKAIKAANIDYIIVTKRTSPHSVIKTKAVELVYENEGIKIYHVQKPKG